MRYKSTIKIIGILLIGLGGFLSAANAAPGDLDTTFSFDGIVREPISKSGNDEIKAIAVQPDGKIVAVGLATYGAPTACIIARYNTDGSFDSSFDGDGKTVNEIECYGVAIQADGKIVVAGNLVKNWNSDFALVRYNPDGSLDTSFDGDGKVITPVLIGNDYARNVAIQADGKIVAIGFSYNGATEDFAVVRYNPNGSLDTSFDGDGKVTTDFLGATDQAHAVAIQTDGRILVGGNAANGTFNSIAIARYNTDGALDTSFDSDGKVLTDILAGHDNANSLAVQTDGKIVAAGQSSVGVGWQIGLVRYNPNGSLDSSFDGDGKLTTVVLGNSDLANSVAIQTDGKIVIGGFCGGMVSGHYVNGFAVVRYNPNGSLDTSFDGDGKATTVILSGNNVANALAIQTDGKIVAAGYSDNDTAFEKFFSVVRYNANGSLDASFDEDGKTTNSVGSRISSAQAVAIQSDGKIVVAGNGYLLNNDVDFALARYNADGSLDTSFGNGGKVITAPGAPNLYDVAHAVAIQADGKIVVVGASGGATAIIVYNPDGS
ncbi:MAG TPA: delta-60 repeat domain-containing protein, partial [Pyrinomonadaceae bacterium]|nr:delta-60 repeat domain-containing protein [Pyrinomonadaceae bacterium]